MDDLLEYGEVQRGLLGIQIDDVSAQLAEEEKLDVVQGVFVRSVNKGSAAESCGIEAGDVITAINGHAVNGVSEMQEWVARNRPGQAIKVTYRRSQTDYQVQAVLKKFDGSLQMKKPDVNYQLEGALFEDISYARLTQLNLDGGVLIKKVEDGKWKKAGAKENFVITHIDKAPVDNVADLNRILELKKGGVLVEGIQENGDKGVFAIEW